jgi:integrase
MGRKRAAGLYERNGVWHIDKQFRGIRICESTGESELAKAEEYLTKKLEEVRQAAVYGVRPGRTFRQAATKYLSEHLHKRSIHDDALHLRQLDRFIGTLSLDSVHMGTLQTFIAARRKGGAKSKTVNAALSVVRRILNLAASEWLDECNLTWRATAPKIKLLTVTDARGAYPLSWEEQTRLFSQLPAHLSRMALFKVNTGCRDQEVCQLRWEWEVKVPELDTFVFIVPGRFVKNGDDRLIVLNRIAKSVVEAQRGQHATHVFTYRSRPTTRMLNKAWIRARAAAGLSQVRVHDLKHTFGRRLRSAGVSFEDRQDLLGHRSSRITTHYSAAELSRLIEAANRVCESSGRRPDLVVLRRRSAL